MSPPRILITGSREFTDVVTMHAAISAAVDEFGSNAIIVHGAARGADQLADVLAETHGLTVERWLAAWELHGHRAGHIRNQAMVDKGADVCLAFRVEGLPCNGTRDCASRAARAGIPVQWFVQKDVPVRNPRTVRGL